MEQLKCYFHLFLHDNSPTSDLFCPILLPDVIKKKHLENITDPKVHSNLKKKHSGMFFAKISGCTWVSAGMMGVMMIKRICVHYSQICMDTVIGMIFPFFKIFFIFIASLVSRWHFTVYHYEWKWIKGFATVILL